MAKEKIAESKYGVRTETLEYTPLTSCVTVTCVLNQGVDMIGGHFEVSGINLIQPALAAMRIQAGGKITDMYVVGVFDCWKSPTNNVPGEYDTVSGAMFRTFAKQLGYVGKIKTLETKGNTKGGAGDDVKFYIRRGGQLLISVNGVTNNKQLDEVSSKD